MTEGSDPTDALADAASVLMIAPDVRDAPVSAYSGLITNGETAPDRVVGVTVGQSPSAWLDAWRRQAGPAGPSLTCVDVESVTRSATAETGVDQPAATLRTVADATDLESLGETVTGELADADGVDDRVAVCVHSLSDLLEHVGEERAFAFLCTLGERVREYDAVVFAHLDASAHDERTVEVFSAVCDAVVEFDGSVEMRVR
jgi:hypothetical protein